MFNVFVTRKRKKDKRYIYWDTNGNALAGC